MTKKEKYDQVFMECFSIEQAKLDDKLIYQSTPEWDSVGHMTLIAAIEEEFDIMIDIDDIIQFSSYTEGVEILKKYEIQL